MLLTLFLGRSRRDVILEDGESDIGDFSDLVLLRKQDIPRSEIQMVNPFLVQITQPSRDLNGNTRAVLKYEYIGLMLDP